MSKAVFFGRFNPLSVGQMNIIRNASVAYDELFVVVIDKNLSQQIVDQDTRYNLVKKVIDDKKLDNVKVIKGKDIGENEEGFANFMSTNGIDTIVRGLFNSSDINTVERRLASKLHDVDDSIDIHYVVIQQDITGSSIRRKLRNNDHNLVDEDGKNLVPEVIKKDVIKLWG